MTSSKQAFPEDKTSRQRRQGLSDEEIKDLELAGGVEGGMQAGRGGPAPKFGKSGSAGQPKGDRQA